MHTSAILIVSWLSIPTFALAVGTEPPAPAASTPLKVTIPTEKPTDQKNLPKGAVLRIGSSSMPRGLEGGFSFSPDGKYLAVGKINQTAQVWEVETGKIVHTFGPFKYSGKSSRNLAGVSFSPDGKTLAVAAGEVAYLFDLNTAKEIGQLEGHTHIIEALVFSQDGKLIVTGSYDQTLAVWNRQTFKRLHSFEGFEAGVIARRFRPMAPSSQVQITMEKSDFGSCLRARH